MTEAVTSSTAPAVPLTQATLGELPEAVPVPRYDRSALVPAVVHIGVGGFHRAHQGVYFDDLAQAGNPEWGLVGVGLHRAEIGEVLEAQDRLYLVVERSPDADRGRVIGALTRYLFGPEDSETVLDVLADERTRLVTLTITGSSYLIDSHTGGFQPDQDDEVAADLEDPGHPGTVFGYLTEALHRRREAGIAPFTILSCDNMPANGAAARTAIVSFARLRDEQLADWIEQTVAFPGSMVDRITPATTPEERDAIAAQLGVDDRWPVVTEPFTQWIIEDSFCNGRPPLDEVGAQFVPDVTPYETMKTRLLNAGHCALGYLGFLAGFRTTDEVLADPVYREYLTRMMAVEIAPLLPDVPGIDLESYQQTLLERLANPRMGDQLARLCRRGSTKIPNYLLPSIRSAMERGRPYELLVLAVAGWMRFLRGYDYGGEETPVQGPRMQLMDIARKAGGDPRPLLAEEDVFGELGKDPRLIGKLEAALLALDETGPREVLMRYLDKDKEIS